jgi:hypothetical protein
MQLRPMSQEIETGTETAFCVENWNKNAFNFHQSEDSLELIVINKLDGIDRSVQSDVGVKCFFFIVVLKASSQLNGQTNCHLSLCFQSQETFYYKWNSILSCFDLILCSFIQLCCLRSSIYEKIQNKIDILLN